MSKFGKIAVVLMIMGLVVCGGCKVHHGKGGTRQPKKGPMPCPIKDC